MASKKKFLTKCFALLNAKKAKEIPSENLLMPMSKVMTSQNKRKLGESKRKRLSFVWSLEEGEDNCQHLYHLDTSYFNYAERQGPVTPD